MKASRQAAAFRKTDHLLWSSYAMHPLDRPPQYSYSIRPRKPKGPRHSKKK